MWGVVIMFRHDTSFIRMVELCRLVSMYKYTVVVVRTQFAPIYSSSLMQETGIPLCK
jgi:hypothetical protein